MNQKWITASILSLLLLIPNCKKDQTPPSAQDGIGALIYMTKGDVTIKDSSGKSIPVEVKVTKVYASHKIETAGQASLDLFLFDGSFIRVYQNTAISVSNLLKESTGSTDSTVNLTKGKIFVKSNGKLPKDRTLRVVTNTTVAGVRGTEFIIEEAEGDNSANILVGEGVVAGGATSEGEVTEIAAGQKLEVQDNSSSLLEMSEEEKSDFAQESQSVASIVESGRSEMQNIFKQFEEEKMQILKTMENKKEENKQLIEDQKEKNKEMIKEQIDKNKSMMNDVKSGTSSEKEAVKDSTKGELNKLQDGAKSEMERLKSGLKNPE
jgi:hypothetical protein